ncbi:MAG: hypothetical protein H7263_18030 [Candidatus Sericytochromatia bacterium]|nr:hypothetical protein [Candidatus Sericytochromatia bacterium]
MNFKELVQSTTDILQTEFSYDELKSVYSLRIGFAGNPDEIVNVYQDVFENEDDGISKKIIVCECLVRKYNDSMNLLEISKSNNDLFFSRVYISEDDKILIESCIFMEILDSLNLSAVINEIAQHSNYLKEQVI